MSEYNESEHENIRKYCRDNDKRIEELEKRLKGWEKTVINATFTTHTHLQVHQKIDKEIAELEKKVDAYRSYQNNCGYSTKLDKEIAEIKSVLKEIINYLTLQCLPDSKKNKTEIDLLTFLLQKLSGEKTVEDISVLGKVSPQQTDSKPEGNKSYIDGWAEGYLVAEKQLTAEFIEDIQDMDRTYIDNDEALNKVIEKWEEKRDV